MIEGGDVCFFVGYDCLFCGLMLVQFMDVVGFEVYVYFGDFVGDVEVLFCEFVGLVVVLYMLWRDVE